MLPWNYIAIILCVLLLAFICRNEWRRLNRARLVLRLLASFFAVASFACLALPLTKKIKAVGGQGKQVVLITEGFNNDSVNGFLKTNSNIPVYTINQELLSAAKNFKGQYTDIGSLKTQADAIHIFGYGLNTGELEALPVSLIRFHPTKIRDGIVAIHWQHKIKTGDPLRVQGNYVNTSAKEIKLIFSGYGVNLDTAIVAANKNANFELTAIPKQLGKAVYVLTALGGTDTVETEPVPFEIEQRGNLKICMLASSPDFENKFLRSWLSQNKYALVTRTTISTNKYEKTFLNTPQVPYSTITTSFLQNFDLLIADARELSAISTPELSAIESQVVQKGMGLIIKGDSSSAKSTFYSRPFPVFRNSDSNRKSSSIYIPVSNQYANVLNTELPAYIRPQQGAKILIEDKQSNIMVSSTIYGAGKLLYTTLNNTYTWMLSGETKNYQTYWSYLLEEATAATIIDRSWNITPAYPTTNKRVEIHYTSNNTEIPKVQIGEDFVRLSQNPDLPFQWRGSYWPKRSGWHPIMQESGNTFWWYAYSANDWNTMAASQKIKATLRSIEGNLEEGSKKVDQHELITVPVSKKYFFIIFLCCVGFLWIEKKL